MSVFRDHLFRVLHVVTRAAAWSSVKKKTNFASHSLSGMTQIGTVEDADVKHVR